MRATLSNMVFYFLIMLMNRHQAHMASNSQFLQQRLHKH